jgi:surface protein G
VQDRQLQGPARDDAAGDLDAHTIADATGVSDANRFAATQRDARFPYAVIAAIRQPLTNSVRSAVGHAHAAAHADPNSDADTDPICSSYRHTRADSNADTNPNTHAIGAAHRHARADTNSDRDSDCDADSEPVGPTDRHARAYADADGDPYADANSKPVGPAHRHAGDYADGDRDSHADTDSALQPDTTTGHHASREPNSAVQRHPDRLARPDARAFGERHANGDRLPLTHADGDLHADLYVDRGASFHSSAEHPALGRSAAWFRRRRNGRGQPGCRAADRPRRVIFVDAQRRHRTLAPASATDA